MIVARRASRPRYDLVVEKDVEIPVRDGARLKADIFRPRSGGRFPGIMNIGGYRKDKLWVPPRDLDEKANPHMNWEAVNPLWWIPRGYAAIRVDTRGSGKSPGLFDPWSRQEALDFYDCIEWAAKQKWCNGRIGTSGISYFAMNQWLVASLKPPSLKAIIPWEGAADMYRDLAYHGGIFCLGFVGNWYNNHMAHHLLGKPQEHNPDAFANNWLWQYLRHNLDTGWFDQRRADWERIDVPMYAFDEVDTGVGGGMAEIIGRKLKSIARHRQVLCITHLPHIAVFADQHFKVEKSVRGERTLSTVRRLTEREQGEEIARMLGGLKISAKTRAAARELLREAKVRAA